MLFPTNFKIHLSKKIYHTRILSPVPLKYLSWVNRSRVIKRNNRGAVCSGCCGVSHIPTSRSRHLFPRQLGDLVPEGSQLSSSLQIPNSWRKPLYLRSCPVPERTYFQWLMEVGRPLCFKAGQRGRAIPAPELLVGLAEASAANASQLNFSLGPVLPPSLLPDVVSESTP